MKIGVIDMKDEKRSQKSKKSSKNEHSAQSKRDQKHEIANKDLKKISGGNAGGGWGNEG